jgi:hypothetical protein
MINRDRLKMQHSPAWVQNVDRPHEWAVEHSWLLDAIFALFDRDGDWPRIGAVQRVLADTSPAQAVAVAQLAIEIPAELGARHADRFTLTTQALSHCNGAKSLLASFVEVIHEAAVTYRASDEEQPAVLSGFAVKQSLGLDDSTYVRVSRLVFREPWFFGSGGGNVDDDWRYDVRAEVLLAEHIADIADYLDVVACYRFGPPEIEKPAMAGSSQRPQDWLTKRDVTVRDLLAITIVGAVVAGVILWLLLG